MPARFWPKAHSDSQLALGVMLLGLIAAAVSWASEPPRSSSPADSEAKPAPHRLREGEVVDLIGRLELAGDRAVFYPPDGEPLRVLENLALERVTQVLTDARDQREWSVAGTITEFRGANYILLSKAVQRAKQEKPVKEPVH